jgi:hypothetical protein
MTWQLWRQDDNGIRFVVGDFATRELAESKMAELARGRHKQIYWISEAREHGESDTGDGYR